MLPSPTFTTLAESLIDGEIDKGNLTGFTDRELDTARQVVAEELEEAWRDSLHELQRAEPSSCRSGRCQTCDRCMAEGDRQRDERREAA